MIPVELKAYIISELNKPRDYYNDSTLNYSSGYRKAMRNVLGRIEELEESTL